MLQPPKEQPTFKLTSSNFANFFRNKVDNICESTATAPPPVIVNRQTTVVHFRAVSECEILKLLHTFKVLLPLPDPYMAVAYMRATVYAECIYVFLSKSCPHR